MTSYVAFLRGVNLGAKNKVPMKELRAVLDDMGYQNVRTYIQSGNILFEADDFVEARVAQEMQAAIEAHFGVVSPVVLRSAAELAAVAAANPFDVAAIEPAKLHVMLLNREPAQEDVARLDPDRSPGDSYVVKNREIYVHFPNGAGRSRLGVDYFDRVLGVTATARNWNTITKLLEMLADS
ncbi:MAG TPA: DUF1697 domain-containing protein [Thermomicrobiales bacterium]|nr:DUF1697 domain-containing protein [Thermomicrobiales bacterium]